MFNFSNFEFSSFDLSDLSEDTALQINKYSKYFLIIVIAFFSAKILTNVLRIYGNRLVVSEDTSNSNIVGLNQKKEIQDQLSNYEVIITRNIFNSTNEIPDEEVNISSEGDGSDSATKSTLPLDLVGTIVLNDPSLSVAAIRVENEDKTNAYIIGDVLLSKAEIVSILRQRVFLKSKITGELEYIEMAFDESDNVETKTRRISDSGIRVIDDEHVIMDRGELNKSLANMNQLLMEARAIPYRKDGEMQGFKILGIRPGSLYDRLGVKNGDVIQSINGVGLKSPADAMKIYNQISTYNNFNFDLLRAGEGKNVKLEIR